MRAVWRYAVLALLALGVVGIVNPARAQNAAARSNDDFNNFLELNVYAGYSDYQAIHAGLGGKIDGGAIIGFRVTENYWNHVAIEEGVNVYSWNKYRFLFDPPNGAQITEPFPIHTVQPAVDVVYHFTPRDHRFRPFILGGIGGSWDVLGKNAVKFGEGQPASAGFVGFNTDEHVQFNYGGGIKYQANKWFGFRMDVRGLIGRAPRFGLSSVPPDSGGAWIPGDKWVNGIQASAGLTLYLFHRGEAPIPPPVIPPKAPEPPRPLGAIAAGTIGGNLGAVCPGDAVQFTSSAADPENHTLAYQWSVNGTNQSGGGPQFTFRANAAGDYRIGLHVADSGDGSRAADAAPVSVHVNRYSPPTVSGATADPSTVDRGQNSAVHVTAMGSDCSGRLTYSWAAAEGSVSGSTADATFNSTSVSFNEGDRSRPQSKQVPVTATVTDSKGGSGSATANITVNLGSEVRHFGDILFPKGSARVNNCGKRVLIEQLYPVLAGNANYDVVLVGHIDASETPKGKARRARELDHERVLQTAAVLSGGGGTCTSLDVSRIKGSWVGTTQESESVPTSCALSTTAPKERKGAAIEDSSEAKNRRVEIWLVPKGMALPAAARDGKELPDADLKKIGCPK